MLVNMNDVLFPAKKNKYAVGLFNAVNLELARGIIGAAESMRAPVIIGTAEVLFPYGPLEEVSYYLIPMAKKGRCSSCSTLGSWFKEGNLFKGTGIRIFFHYV